MSRRFMHALFVVFITFSSLTVPVFLTAAPATASTTAVPSSHGTNWIAVLGVIFFASSLIVTIWAVFFRKPRPPRDPFAGGTLTDQTDVMDAITDPGLPAHGYERPEPVTQTFGPEPSNVTLVGSVVDEQDWTMAMTVPAPPIVAKPTDLAEAWLAAWDAGEILDTGEWSATMAHRMLAGAQE